MAADDKSTVILLCHDDDFINELNAVNDLYFADRLEFNPSEHEFDVENFECDNDEVDDWCCMRFYRAIGRGHSGICKVASI